MLYRICSVVRRGVTSRKGDGSIFRYFCGEVAELRGVQRLLFGDWDEGLSSGSKSIVLLRVAPQAMASRCGPAERWGGKGRGGNWGREQAAARDPAASADDRRKAGFIFQP